MCAVEMSNAAAAPSSCFIFRIKESKLSPANLNNKYLQKFLVGLVISADVQ